MRNRGSGSDTVVMGLALAGGFVLRAVLSAAALAALLAVLAGAARAAAPARPPNVVVILADDLGYEDIGVQGGKDIPTPHIDSIARNGVRFTRGYVSGPYCSPTRAGLLTGRYQQRFGHEFNEGTGRLPFGLPLGETTFAQRMKALGYATAAVGKWHLGALPEMRPTRRGFDEFYGTLGNTPFVHPQLVDSRVGPDPRRVEDPAFYTTDAYADRAVDFIGRNKDKPFFLYLPFNACHTPMQATDKALARFKHIADEQRRLYAAMMSSMDDAVGRVLGALGAARLVERTLVFFLSDNGGPETKMGPNGSRNGALRGGKGDTWEGGVRVPFFVQWKGRLPAGTTYTKPVIQLDILPTALAAAGAGVRGGS
jgi:arylsulfatase A-like enzyme